MSLSSSFNISASAQAAQPAVSLQHQGALTAGTLIRLQVTVAPSLASQKVSGSNFAEHLRLMLRANVAAKRALWRV